MKKYMLVFLCIYLLTQSVIYTQNIQNNVTSNHGNKFEQLGTILPDANNYRAASGSPGHEYWQQRADYKIKAFLNEKELTLNGEEEIIYYNNSPDVLSYLWLQLDENQHQPNAESNTFDESNLLNPLTDESLYGFNFKENLAGYGVNILSVTDAKGNPLPYIINYTMMRVELPTALKAKGKFVFKIKWNYKILNRKKTFSRGGFEKFEDDGQCVFMVTQWYPRMCVYSDFQGWNNKQYTGRGEFALTFGNFDVTMVVPADHIVSATGECTNYSKVLNKTELLRWKKAQSANTPVEIVTREEAIAKEKKPDQNNYKTWNFKAENVRDFAWGSSRKFIWDAMAINIEGKKIMAMSYYPDEAYALYSRYSTKVIAHTLKVYSKFTIPYPYPVAISVEAANGMEYPMISFNYGRTEPDGTYSEGTKYGMIGVIIHEVGHNFFPMIINSDERQWSWMDEGLNTFVQFLAEQEFDNNFPSRRGPAHKIIDYMRMPKNQLEPIMTNSENIIEFGNNAYGKPCTALNILRETIMGRELFDYAFKQYCKRWAFKHPTPADFFRTMEDASGIDLDWFWRGWFYDIEPVDISIDSIQSYQIVLGKTLPVKMQEWYLQPPIKENFKHISKTRNRQSGMQFLVDTDTTLRDFYYYYLPKTDTIGKTIFLNEYHHLNTFTEIEFKKHDGKYIYQLYFTNKGGLVMPIILQWNYKDGTSELEQISAYIWRKNEKNIAKAFIKDKEVISVVLDPYRETADIEEKNNTWPLVPTLSRVELFKNKTIIRGEDNANNPMQKAKTK